MGDKYISKNIIKVVLLRCCSSSRIQKSFSGPNVWLRREKAFSYMLLENQTPGCSIGFRCGDSKDQSNRFYCHTHQIIQWPLVPCAVMFQLIHSCFFYYLSSICVVLRECNVQQVWMATYSAQCDPQGWRKSLDQTGGLTQRRSSFHCPPRLSRRCWASLQEGSGNRQSRTLSPQHQSTAGGVKPLHPGSLWGAWLGWKQTDTRLVHRPDLQEVRRKAGRLRRRCDSACWLASSPG